jgi:hypothetical protein
MVKLMQVIGVENFKREFANSPRILSYLEAYFSDELNAEDWTLLSDSADESSFSLRDWVESLIVVGHWLDAHSKELSFEDQIGYISCAGDSAGAGTNLEHLPALVESMLEQYGCERAEPRNT